MKQKPIVQGHERQYRIDRELGAGATSVVYLATIVETSEQVALKVLRPDAGETIIKSFFLEADILRDLYDAERQLDGQHAIPQLYETQRDPEPRFLALELIRGTSLETLIDGSPYYLEEPVALQITAQVARVLHVLHTQLKRSYTDFQLKNIYWDAERNQVQVIDWNHVSEPNKGNPQTDLTLLGVYLYRMVTGRQASERGETERVLERRGGDRWTALSLGCRRMIIQALHPNPQRRFDNAEAMRDSAEWLVARWDKTGVDLALETSTYLEGTEEKNLEYASTLVDLARRKGDMAAEGLNKIEAMIAEGDPGLIDPLQPGRTLYESGDYKLAAERWRKVASTHGRLQYWRRVQVAQAGVVNGPEFTKVRPQVDAVIDLIEKTEYAQALEQIKPHTAKFVPLQAIQAELEARQLIWEAQRLEDQAKQEDRHGKAEASTNYQEAAKKYEEAEVKLKSIP